MNLIKLDAIDSTNDFLKEMSRNQVLENFTTVTARSQTKGKGQMGSSWNSETGKNLIMSVLIKDVLANVSEIFNLNIVIALSVIQVLEEKKVPNLSVKWPNDIMSDNKKLCGILIENSFKSDSSIESVAGIGLNVNQKVFDNLPKAASMSVVMHQEFDLENLIKLVHFKIKRNCGLLLLQQSEELWNEFHRYLFKINSPMPFEDAFKNRFMAIIQGVTNEGKLKLLLEDDSIKTYGIKEVQLLF